MTLDDFVTVIVPHNRRQEEIYHDIVTSVGLPPPIVVGSTDKEDIARKVAALVGERRSVTIGRKHYICAFCYNDEETALVTFDADTDYPFYGNLADSPLSFGNGTFLNERQGMTYILGSNVKSDNQRVKVYPPRKIEKVLKEDIPEQVFLSLDIDVFDKEVTEAHDRPHYDVIKRLERALGIKTHLSFEEVLALSQQLLRGRTLVGVNIAEYDPQLEQPPYKTAELLKRYLKGVLSNDSHHNPNLSQNG